MIGVVVALTLPSLISNYRDQSDIAKLKKIYTIMQQANMSAVAKHGDVKYWENIDNTLRYISQELKVLHYYESLTNLYGLRDYKKLLGDSNQYNGILAATAGFITNDGSVIGIMGYKQPEGSSFDACSIDKDRYCYWIMVDINGINNPNRYGYDVFVFNVMGDNKVKPAANLKRCTPTFDSSSDAHPNGESCATWVLLKNNMDYKKCIKGVKKYCDIDYDILN